MVIKLVVDTNILVAAAYSASSSSRKIVRACIEAEKFEALVSEPLLKEYRFILARALRGARWTEPLETMIARASRVEAEPEQHPLPGDPSDAKVMATAVGGMADAIVTNDRYLLSLDPYQGIPVLSPTQTLRTFGAK